MLYCEKRNVHEPKRLHLNRADDCRCNYRHTSLRRYSTIRRVYSKTKLTRVQAVISPIKQTIAQWYGDNGSCIDSSVASQMTSLGSQAPTLVNPTGDISLIALGGSGSTCTVTLTINKLGSNFSDSAY